jgi:CRISPR type III-A/MTUBE-associated RAMP protein Csm5
MPDSIRYYRLIPLSPVHIGSGERLAPEEYDIIDSHLVRFNSSSVLRAMTHSERQRYMGMVDQNKLTEALGLLREVFRRALKDKASRAEMYRVRLGADSRRELGEAVARSETRKGEVQSLLRNPYTGSVIIPGSAIKGAIRTATLSQLIEGRLEEVRRDVEAAQKWKDTVLEESGFEYKRRETERDPMRVLEVSDGQWPAEGVQIDKPSLRKLGRDEGKTSGVQIHTERLLSQADSVPPPSCVITLQLNEDLLRHRWTSGVFDKLSLDWFEYWCNRFFGQRLHDEWDRFKNLFGNQGPWFPNPKKGDVLLRVGRYCHFESLSVDGLRRSYNVRTKTQITAGSTRTVCPLNAGGIAPFGWVLLRRVG